jgi:major vault protein
MPADDRYPEGRGVNRRTTNELVLPEGEFAYTRDTTSGVTYVRRGPCSVVAEGKDEAVIYNKDTGRFETVSLSEAAQADIVVPVGSYAMLNNPSKDGTFPDEGGKTNCKGLLIGQRIHIPGPKSFALWPQQYVEVIEGHQLRSNQYLMVRVYDEQAARENWAKAVVKKAASADETTSEEADKTGDVSVVASDDIPEDLSVGRLLVIRGTKVSFYIPPTGIEVVKDERGQYVREALTLERLQYCILVDEDGNKRYRRGPEVVFPLPTERFYENESGERVFRPIELNGPIQGLHIKVIAAYTDEKGDHGPSGKEYKEGDELFITGETTPIYFPCEQHSAIRYDGKTKHFATAIPAGDGRYVLNRHSGGIKMLEGGEEGTMSLPDPRQQVFVRRVLSDTECEAMYPGNEEALNYNRALREIQAKTPTTRKGVVSEGDLRRSKKHRLAASRGLALDGAEFADASYSAGHTGAEMGGDEFSRAATYTEPRTVTLGEDKFAGVPKINPWTGYAVMVTDTTGKRRVEVGPKRVLLGFNETLEVLSLSTGKPKTTDSLLNTAYLQVEHNKITDVLWAETKDHVRVEMKLALRVNFEGEDKTRWFSVSNYVKLLCDHVRSVLKASIRKVGVEQFWPISEDYIRDTILGKKPEDGERTGMVFPENGMRVYDVEVLKVLIGDQEIQNLLVSAQHEAVETSISLAQDQRRLEATKKREKITREELQAQAETEEYRGQLEIEAIAFALKTGLAKIDSQIEQTAKSLEHQKEQDAVKAAAVEAEIKRQRAQADNNIEIEQARMALRLEELAKQTAATVDQLKAVEPGFSEALLALGNQETLQKVAEAMSVQNFLGGKDLAEVIQKVFAGTPLEGLVKKVQERAQGNGGGSRPVEMRR